MTAILGILGGIGSGKSKVTALFVQLGAVALDADKIAHAVLLEEPIRHELRRVFGDDVLDDKGMVHSKNLAKLVFAEGMEEALAQLNSIVHPEVRKRIYSGMQEAKNASAQLLILDIPLLLRSPFREECDQFLFVKSRLETRLERVKHRGWSEEELIRRESSQTSLEEKEQLADFVLNNDDSPELLEEQVRELFKVLTNS